MTQVILYTQSGCKKSDKAKQLLSNRKVSYSEMDVSCNVFMKREMMERTGARLLRHKFL
jgi:arsenate reductase-like glutaredoxin family protein